MLNSKLEELAFNKKIKDLKVNFQAIHNGYEENSGIGEKYISSNDDALCYAFFRMPSTTAVISRCLSFFPHDERGLSLLDLGAGTGASVFAILNEGLEVKKVTAIEESSHMIKVFNELISDVEVPFLVEQINKDFTKENLDKYKSDIVLASYSMNELNSKDRVKFLDTLWSIANKYILIIEPGTPKAFNEIMSYKEFFLSKGGHIIAPCMSEDCPIIKAELNDWCHFSVRLRRPNIEMKIKDASRNFEDEKFTFLLISKEKVKAKESDIEGIIIRRPNIQKGKVSIRLCTNKGMLVEKVYTKKDKEVYKNIKKLEIGDYIK